MSKRSFFENLESGAGGGIELSEISFGEDIQLINSNNCS
jgi:hypothetical protein